MSLESIPLEVILCYILPYLHISDILTLCVISRSLNKDFDDNKVWREMYIRKRKEDFYKLEHTKVKKLVFDWRAFHGQWPSQVESPEEREEARDTNGGDVISLFIHNNSDITFDIVHARGIGIWTSKAVPFGTVAPHSFRVIKTYVKHRWLITAQKNNRTNEVYQSKGFIIRSSDVTHKPIKIRKANGTMKVHENVVHIDMGEIYDKDTAKKLLNTTLPKNPRNYKDFKGMTLRSQLSKVKKNKKDKEQKVYYDQVLLNTKKQQLEDLQQDIQYSEENLNFEKEKLKRMKMFVHTVEAL